MPRGRVRQPGEGAVDRDSLENALKGILVAPFEAHAGFINHPEDEAPLNMADGLPIEDQWGAVHVNKNQDVSANEALMQAAMSQYDESDIDPYYRDVKLPPGRGPKDNK